MAGIVIEKFGDFHSTLSFLQGLVDRDPIDILRRYGELGVEVLGNATPKRTGKTAASWSYKINRVFKGYELSWTNSNISQGYNVALLIQYGHGTKSGYWIEGRDYINPVIRPLVDQLSQELRGGI